MFTATSLASVLNYVFNMIMGRMLGPGEYSVMSALLGVYVVISIPAAVLGTVVAKGVSDRLSLGKAEEVGGVIWGTWSLVVRYGGGAVLFLLALSPWLARFLQLDSVWPVIATFSIVLPALALFVARGCLQGAQWFGALALNTVLEAVLRLGCGVALVALGWGASGGLLALMCSSLGVLILAIWSLRSFLRRRAAPMRVSGQAHYFMFTLAGYLAFAVLTNMDVVLVRHFFPPHTAGEYAAVATLGKIVLFFPASVATVMFPKTARRRARRQETVSAVGKSALVTLALCVVPIGGMFVWARPFLSWSYGDAYLGGAANLLPVYGMSMGLYALISLFLQYFLSVDDMRFVFALAVATVLSLLGIGAFHASAVQVVTVISAVGGLTVVAGTLLCVFSVPIRRVT